ncbi:PAS domain-containing protein [Roseomonas sp. USHLN139]|uniref:PAS domain-containing protein n=1 Tax=Roseomonas sp. USHLN139 TaxID=3081298 RepID=UPI003B0175B7
MTGRAPPRSPTVRLHLMMLALAALLPAWGLGFHVAGQVADAERARLVSQAREMAQDLAFSLEREILGMRGELAALAASPALREHDLAAFYAQARALPLQRDAQLRLSDSQGRLLVDTTQAFPPPETESPLRPPPRTPGISNLIASANPLRPFRIDLSQAVRNPAGPGTAETLPDLLLTASTDPSRLWAAHLKRANLPETWIAVLYDGEGRQITRMPPRPELVGTLRREGGAVAQAMASPAPRGWARTQSSDDRPLYTVWQRVGGTPWLALVAMPADMLDGALWRALAPVLVAGALLLAGFTAMLAFWTDRRIAVPLARLGRVAQAFGNGAAPPGFPPTGLREIDAAAEALQAAGRERERLEAERIALTARLQTVLESTTDCVLVLDGEGLLRYLNGRAAALAGGQQGIGRPLAETFPGWDAGPFGTACRVARRQGLSQSVTAFHPALGRWISADVYPSSEGITLFFRDVSDERAAQVALRESEARLKAVLDNVPVGVLLAEAPGGRLLLGNRRLAEMLRGPISLSRGVEDYSQDWEAYHADGSRVASEEFPLSRALRDGVPASGEYQFRAGDGSMIWIRVSGAPVRDARAQVTGAVVALADIDAERRAAAQLQESELRFRLLAEAIPQIVWSAKPDGRIDYINPRMQDFTGLTPERAAGALGSIVHPADQRSTFRRWQRALRRGRPFAAELRLRRPDGGWRWCVIRALPAFDQDRNVTRWIGAVTDVSELAETREALSRQVAAQAASREAAVQAAAALAASESRFRRFAEASPDVMWMRDPAGEQPEFVSPAFERIWGIARERLVENPGLWLESIHPADRDRVAAAWAEAARDGNFDAEYRILRPDGVMRWIRDIGFPMLDAQGAMIRRGGLARDVSAAKASEARQLLLLGELNHRVKNTLATVHSLALQTARTAGSAADAMPRFLNDFQARLLTLSRGHDLLTARTWRGASMEDIARAALAPWQVEDGPDGTARLSLAGPSVWLAPRQALGLALAMHELATNATKHGALSCAEGRVVVAWHGTAEGLVRLDWREEGGPPVKGVPSRRGFGSRMLERGLPAELGPGSAVELDYAADGFRASIRFRPVSGPQVEEETA